jgi:hypothetical protein
MRMERPRILSSDNLSIAWAKIFTLLLAKGYAPGPTVLSVTGFENSRPIEDAELRMAIESELVAANKVSIEDNAYGIFPYSLWLRKGVGDRQNLFNTYRKMLPRLKARDRRNQYGTYFNRMIDFPGIKDDRQVSVNQLEHILTVWGRDRKRRRRTRLSALQIACFDPVHDHSGQPVRGFPCLQQVSLVYDDNGGLAVNAFYPTQYVFDRGYGNYLGLCHLGHFMAHEMGLRLTRLTCFIGAPLLGDGSGKKSLFVLGDLAMKACEAVSNEGNHE